MKKIIAISTLFIFGLIVDVSAQCAMCRVTVSSNLSEGRNTIGTGLNTGILYLLAIPYIIVGLGIFFYIRTAKKNLREQGLA